MTKQIQVGGVAVGGGAPVSIQSMTNRPAHDVEGTVVQLRQLASAGCEIARLAFSVIISLQLRVKNQ